jgi:2-polyprenyl-3-methyl-5-hydroxy-6-metoxy-1,4-benzoquinol methylase
VSSAQKFEFKVKDFSVSGELFDLIFDQDYQLYKTYPQPDIDKLSKYYESDDYISHTGHRRNFKEYLYYLVKQIALRNKLKLINGFKTDAKTILDLGCGTGDFLKLCYKDGWEITGIEPSVKARDIANQKLNNLVFDANEINNFKNKKFDVITLWHVLEHLPNLKEAIINFKQLLKPNGVLIVAVPNFKSYDANYYQSYWAAWDVPRHLWHFSQFSISKLFGEVSMKIIETRPMYFDAYYVSLLSEKYKFGKHRFLNAFWIGLKSNWSARQSGEFSSLIYVLKNKNN